MDQEIPTTTAVAAAASVVHDGNKSTSNDDDDDNDSVKGTTAAGATRMIRQALILRQPLHSTPDDPLDPIEWTVRKLIPIPETYYWEYTPPADVAVPENWQTTLLPWHVKVWHCSIAAADAALQWTDRWIAQPVASATGLTAPRMSHVTDHMTEAEWAAARQRLRVQQCQQRWIREQHGGENKMVVMDQKGKLVAEQFVELESNEIPVQER